MISLANHDTVTRTRTSIDPFLWMGIAACVGALVTIEPLVTVISVAFGLVLLVGFAVPRQRRALVVLAFAVVLFALTAFRAERILSAHENDRGRTIEASTWPDRCVVTGLIVRSPLVVGGALRVDLDATEPLDCKNSKQPLFIDGPLTFHFKVEPEPRERAPPVLKVPDLARGDLVKVTGSLAPPYRFLNDGAGDPRPSAARRGALLSGGAEDILVLRRGGGLFHWIDRMRAHIRQRILLTYREGPSEAMARALVLGEDDLAADDQRAFRKSGLSHLLAVSGMHLVLVVMGFVAFVQGLLVRIVMLAARCEVGRIASALGLPVAWIYAELAGGSGSAVRAAWMCSIVLLARALGRRGSVWRGLGLSILVMALIDPLVIFDISFVLSALATLGIVSMAKPMEAALVSAMRSLSRSWSRPRWCRSLFEVGEEGEKESFLTRFVVRPLTTTLAATIACAPALALLSPELPLGGLVANVIAVPLGEALALPLCLVHVVLVMWPSVESGCALAAGGALALVRAVARSFAWGAVPIPAPLASQLGVLAVGAVLVAHVAGRRAWHMTNSFAAFVVRRRAALLIVGALALVALEAVARVRGSPKGVLRVTFLDVGQGDAALIDLPDGSSMLIDGGGLVGSPLDVGERAILPVFRARRRGSVDVVVLSHPHPDHFLGLSTVLRTIPTRSFWDTGQGEAEGTGGGYALLLNDLRQRGVKIERPSTSTSSSLCGERKVGGAKIEVLAPCPAPMADRNANDNSFVIRMSFGERSILLVGDAEHAEEKELIDRYGVDALRADVLKVGHHGSRTSSTPAFVDAVRPSVAIISCGIRNRFGHPHASTLRTLESRKIRILRTDKNGSVKITTDGKNLTVEPVNE